MKCAQCGISLTMRKHAPTPAGDLCVDCYTEWEKKEMILNGKAILYLNYPYIQNWFGKTIAEFSSFFPRKHNIAGTQTYIYFYGPDHKKWVGRQTGDNTFIRCKRLVRQSKPI